MSKIYLEVVVPGNAKTYDFSADSMMSVRRVKNDIISQITIHHIIPSTSQNLIC